MAKNKFTFQSTAEATEINANVMEKLLNKGATGFSIYLLNTSNSYSALTKSKIPDPVAELLEKFPTIFAEPKGLPPARAFDHEIPLKPGTPPPYSRLYRLPHQHTNEMEHQVQHLLKSGMIRESQSPYALAAILVGKKDKSWRLCLDFRKLNVVTIRNKYPIPVIEDLIAELFGANFFHKFGFKIWLSQIRMSEKDIRKQLLSLILGIMSV